MARNSNDENNRKLTTEDYVNIGLATKSPGAFLFSTLIIEIAKLPFSLVGGAIKSSKGATEKRRLEALEEKRKLEAEKIAQEQKALLLAEKKKALKEKEERYKKEVHTEAILNELSIKSPENEITAELGKEVKGLLYRDNYYICEYTLLHRLLQSQSIQDYLTKNEISPKALEEKITKLMEGKRRELGNSTSHLVPKTRMVLAKAGKIAKQRYLAQGKQTKNIVDIEPLDVLLGGFETTNFITELGPLWEHLKNKPQES
jgi:hypothetical protein